MAHASTTSLAAVLILLSLAGCSHSDADVHMELRADLDCLNTQRMDYPDLGSDAPRTKVIFFKMPCGNREAGQALILVQSPDADWHVISTGSYQSGHNRVGRGGKNRYYVLVSPQAEQTILSYRGDRLMLKDSLGRTLYSKSFSGQP